MISRMESIHDYKYNSVLLETNDGLASGFFLEFEFLDKSKMICLITNQHVVKNSKFLSFKVHTELQDRRFFRLTFDLSSSLNLYFGTENLLGSEYMDLIAFPFLVENDNVYEYYNEPIFDNGHVTAKELKIKILEISQVLPKENYSTLNPSDLVYVYGYPRGRHDEYNYTPMIYKGDISSIPNQNFNGERVFTVNVDARKGSSGSPVVSIQNDEIFLIGVVRSGKEEESHTECLKTDFFCQSNLEFRKMPKDLW